MAFFLPYIVITLQEYKDILTTVAFFLPYIVITLQEYKDIMKVKQAKKIQVRLSITPRIMRRVEPLCGDGKEYDSVQSGELKSELKEEIAEYMRESHSR